MKLSRFFCLLTALTISFQLFADLTIEDYCDLSINTPKSILDAVAMKDGEYYVCLSADGKTIGKYSFAKGSKTGEIFNVDNLTGDIKVDKIDGFVLTKNEKKILVWNNKEKIYRHSFKAEYYVYDIFTRSLTRVSKNGLQRNATISPDGRYVAFTRDNNIYLSNIDYKTEDRITKDGEINRIIYGSPDWSYEEEFGISNTIRWNNDGTILTYMRFDETNVPEFSFTDYQNSCSGDFLKNLYPGTFDYKYPLAGYPNSIVSVYSYNLDSGLTKKMDIPMEETSYIPSIEFDGKGVNLMVMVLNRDQNNLNLYSVNPSSTVSKLIYNESSNAWLSPWSYQMVDYQADNFVIASEKDGYRHLYLYDYSGKFVKQLTKGTFNVTDYYGKKPGTQLYFMQTTSLGAINRNIAMVDEKGKLNLLNKEAGTASACFSANFDYYIRNYSSGEVPPQYHIFNLSGKKLVDLELNEAYAKQYASAPKPEFFTIKNDSGEEMDAFTLKPTDFKENQKYPLVMYQYNGPESQEVLNKWRMEGIYYLASLGYVVTCVDGRGTGNRNSEWSKCVYKDLGKYETIDQLSAVAYMKSLPYIDSNRVACFGWSYGGYMTLMEMTSGNSPFKAGIAMAPVSDWRFYDSIYTERFMLTPQQNEAGYKASSPLERSDKLKGELLIISGTNDDNVHFFNTLRFSSKVSAEGHNIDMMVYPGFEHSLRMCDARVQLFRKIATFLNQQL